MMCRFALAALLALAPAAGSAPPQSDTLRQLRFSPDGKYVLAQNASEITILSVRPLAVLSRIPAEFASNAQFTPDSLQILFMRSLARADRRAAVGQERVLLIRSASLVERWRVADGTRVDSREIKGVRCATARLSPDGRTLACEDSEGTLRLIDVASVETLFEKRNFVRLFPIYNFNPDGSIDVPNGQFTGELGHVSMDLSPDGRFLVASPSGGDGKALAWDLQERRAVGLTGRLREITGSIFLWPHRLLILQSGSKQGVGTAELVAFPSTEILSKFKVPVGPLFRTADPDFVLVRPFGLAAATNAFFAVKPLNTGGPDARRAAVAELATGEVIISKTPALDVLGRYYVAEPFAGAVGLYERGKGLQATVALREK